MIVDGKFVFQEVETSPCFCCKGRNDGEVRGIIYLEITVVPGVGVVVSLDVFNGDLSVV